MDETFDVGLKAHVLHDQEGRVRSIRHSEEHWEAQAGGALAAAGEYLHDLAGTYEVDSSELARLEVPVDYLAPEPREPEFRLSEQVEAFDSATFGFAQTVHNTPVWRTGIRVTVKAGPHRVVQSESTALRDVKVDPPSEATVERYRAQFRAAEVARARKAAGDQKADRGEETGRALVLDVLNPRPRNRRLSRKGGRLIRGRFWIYRYDEAAREDHHEHAPRLPLPPVDKTIEEGRDYFVAEMTFDLPAAGRDHLTWRTLVEIETGSILYARALSSDLNGQVFQNDPPTKTGNTALSSASNNATLNTHRDTVVLQNLGAAVAGTQSLVGTYAELRDIEGETIAAPTKPSGTDFLYNARTNDFAAVSAYFHVDRLFRTVGDLGFTVTGPTGYFRNTSFPVGVDHRCEAGTTINAHCTGDGSGGIDHVGYGLMDTTDTANPLGRAADPRVTWHEVCGHGILYEYVDHSNFGFAHSAGDSLSGIFFDPDSLLRGVDGTPLGKPGDLRFTYVPWHPSLNRRFDRNVAGGWAFGGSMDNEGYGSEEILATTLFRIYRSIGGDSDNVSRRRFASRMMLYLLLRAVQNLTPATNPANARDFAASMVTVDQLNWTSEGVFGGAYGKVIRWSFERQGEYQTPLVVKGVAPDGTITAPGQPPAQDVYIDDGRAGHYQFQPVHWHTTTIWNRRAADGLPGHQEPELGATNYAYVKIKNRGTAAATNVVVRGFHTKPGAGLLWPNDFDPFTTASINVGTVGGNDTDEQTVGPFEWTPNINAYGHDCMLMVASASGDAANIDTFTAGEVIPEWRLVPNDNNIGQRNVFPVAAAGGGEGLMESLDGVSIWIGNPNPRRAKITLHVTLPSFLVEMGWRLEAGEAEAFVLKPGERREVKLRLHQGEEFDPAWVEKEADITVEARTNGIVLGGMTYRLDPKLEHPHNRRKPQRKDPGPAAGKLLDHLGLPGQAVQGAKVREIILGVRIRDDDDR